MLVKLLNSNILSLNFLKNKAFYVCFLILIISIYVRFPSNDTYIFKDADASYHVLLTTKAYSETSFLIHKFLPIVSLGNKADKEIPWGDTVPDKYGNYYYTSFYTIGFIIPYIFFKIFLLEPSISNLYLFNSLLLIISWVGMIQLLFTIFKKISVQKIIIITTLSYVFQIEIMHSQGIAYWHQSLFQPLIIFQLIFYINKDNKNNFVYFIILCFINPLVEWTGYVSNIGFAILYLFQNFNKDFLNQKSVFYKVIVTPITIVFVSIFSFLVYYFHYLSIIQHSVLSQIIMKRFNARSSKSDTFFNELYGLFTEYYQSYEYLLIFLLSLTLLCFILIFFKKFRLIVFKNFKRYSYLIFLSFFPFIENLLLIQHATLYSFDRIKIAIPLIILLLIFYEILIDIFKSNIIFWVFTIILSISAFVNIYWYTYYNNFYRRKEPYLLINRQNALYINKLYNKSNSILTHNYPVRGYSNLLFNRGIHENVGLVQGIEIAKYLKKRYVIIFDIPANEGIYTAMYDLGKFQVYDLLENKFVN